MCRKLTWLFRYHRDRFTAVFLSAVIALSPVTSIAETPKISYSDLEPQLSELSSDDLENLLVFVAGNALFASYHEAGHMLINLFRIPVLGQEEDAVDNLATLSMLADRTEDMDLLLINAMIGWFLAASIDDNDLAFYGEHGLDEQRGYRILCLMVGADEETFTELARDLEMPEDRIETCSYDYGQTSASWEEVTDPFLRSSDTPGGRISVVHEPAPDGLESLAQFLKEAEILEQVAEELDTFYDLPDTVTFRAATCGEESASWDPNTREVIVCHEFLGGLADLYLSELLPAN